MNHKILFWKLLIEFALFVEKELQKIHQLFEVELWI